MASPLHIAVAQARSSVRFGLDESLTFGDVPAGKQRVTIVVRTNYVNEGFTKPLPRELSIEARGTMPTFEEGIVELTNAASMILPAIAFCANAPIDEPELQIGLQLTDEGTEHKFFQRQVSSERGFPNARRRVPKAAVIPFIQRWLEHPDAERIYRAIAQYGLALRHSAAGHEILAHAHYYMALEALTKALLRDECQRRKKTENELVSEWQIDKRELDSEIRLRRIFGGDRVLQSAARSASDGFEHGFANFSDIRAKAESVALKTARGIRQAVFDLISLAPQHRALLMAKPYGHPMDPRPLDQVVKGNLVGPVDGLARAPYLYPFVNWNFAMADYLGEDTDGSMQFKLKDTRITPHIGPNCGFQLTAFEVRRPDANGKVTAMKGEATVRMPEEVLSDVRNDISEIRSALPSVARQVAAGQMRDLLIALGNRSKKLTKRDLAQFDRKVGKLERNILPYHLASAVLAGQIPVNVARYILLERATAETLLANGVRAARQQDAFDLTLQKYALALKEEKVLTMQTAYPAASTMRDKLVDELSRPECEVPLRPILDSWYASEDCVSILRYAGQYKTRATRFLFARPKRFTQSTLIRLCEQYTHHAGLFQQQLRLLLALNHSAAGKQRFHTDIEEKNLDSLLNSEKTSQTVKDIASALDRPIRNALAHGIPSIDPDRHRCIFKDRGNTITLSFDEVFNKTMRLTVTSLCLLSLDQRLHQRWMKERIDMLLRG